MRLDLDSLRARLPLRDVAWFDSTPSTMIEAARLAGAGCRTGTVVVAEEQSAGQGRHGRNWHSERGTGLYVTIVLRPGLEPGQLRTLTLAIGLAVQEAIHAATGVPCDLRWPNDLLAGGKKCAGILVQNTESAVLAGVGINVNQTAFPPDLSAAATSLRLVSGDDHSREDLLVALLASVDRYCELLEKQGGEAVLRRYAEKGQRHNAKRGGGNATGS